MATFATPFDIRRKRLALGGTTGTAAANQQVGGVIGDAPMALKDMMIATDTAGRGAVAPLGGAMTDIFKKLQGAQTTSPVPGPQIPTNVPLTPITAENNLGTSAILPGGRTPVPGIDEITQRIAGGQNPEFNPIEAGSFAPRADTQSLRSLIGPAAQSLLEGPDRTELAQTLFGNFLERDQERLGQETRNVGRDAAKFGRIGSGVTTSKIGDAFERSEENRDRLRSDLSATTAGQILSDRLGILGGLQGATGQLFDLDSREAGVHRSLRDEARGERSAEGRFAADVLGLDQQRVASLLGLEGFRDEQGRSDRAELRGERAFQVDRAESATDRRVQQAQLEEAFRNNDFSKIMQLLQTSGSLGFGGSSPLNALLAGSGSEADFARQLLQASSGAFSNLGASNAQGEGGFTADDLSRLLMRPGVMI